MDRKLRDESAGDMALWSIHFIFLNISLTKRHGRENRIDTV